MKKLLSFALAALALVVCVSACSKAPESEEESREALVGVWKATSGDDCTIVFTMTTITVKCDGDVAGPYVYSLSNDLNQGMNLITFKADVVGELQVHYYKNKENKLTLMPCCINWPVQWELDYLKSI